MKVSLCYFIMVHKGPDQFARLLSKLNDSRDHVIVHISRIASASDRRALESIVLGHRGVTLMPSMHLRWGHWSLVECHRRAIALALGRPGWDYFINLSGSCYPIKPVDQLRETLATGGPPKESDRFWPNYMTVQPIAECPKLVRRWFERYWVLIDERDRGVPLWRRRPPADIDFRWKGSNWTVLHREFCRWLDEDPVAERIRCHLRFAKHPTEFWQQWCLMNSPFRETRRPSLHYVRWSGEAHPLALTSADVPALRLSRAFFARKFDPEVDPEVLDRVEAMVGGLSS